MLEYLYGEKVWLVISLSHYPVTLLPVGSGYFRAKPFPRINTPTFSNLVILDTYLPMKMEQTVFRNVEI